MRHATGLFAATFILLGTTLPADTTEEKTERVVAGERFKAGGLHRFLFGANYRDLWTMPVDVPVLDLYAFAGGLRVVRRLGHGQTKALALEGADGVAYTFRPVLKDPVGLLPPELRETLAGSVVRDQMASQHPAGHVVVPPLLDVLGILHNTPRLYVMPDDPALGEFRADFKGLVGDIEEFTGQKGFGGAEAIIDGAEMWKRLEAGPETRVDSRAYLKARLLDHLVGDWDRHREQWRWAKLKDTPRWQPIPEDRDQAFVRFEGLMVSLLRPTLPLLVHFGPKYSSVDGLTFDGWDVDRRLLSDLERPVYREVAAAMKQQLTDAVIESAVARMPKAYFDKAGASMIADLKRRRDTLEVQAERFYHYLAREVDVRATQRDDSAAVERFAGGDMELSLRSGGADEAPYYHRRFHAAETSEVRLYLLGGDDRVAVHGPRGGPVLRVVGGDGRDVVDDAATGGTHFSDASGSDTLSRGPGTSFDRKAYAAPPPNPRGDWIPPRDWGRRTLFPITRFTYNTDLGVLINVGLLSTGYGFRKDPFSDRQALRVTYATEHKAFRGDYEGIFHRENSAVYFDFRARASGIDIVHFYGFGNQTTSEGTNDFYRVEQQQYTLVPSLVVPLGKRGDFSLGPIARYVVTDDSDDTFVNETKPYGVEDRGQVGGAARLAFDSTDKRGLPSRGVAFKLIGTFYPKAWDVKDSFGEIHADATTYLSAGGSRQPTLVLHAGGKQVWGDYPFDEAAFLGGGDSVRGLKANRYAGDAAVFGSAELRLSLAKAFLFVPGEIGIFGLSDVGRVFLAGEHSEQWHYGLGGGLFFASPNRNNAVRLAFAWSEGRLGVYLRTGLTF